jgi:hypothetical protein
MDRIGCDTGHVRLLNGVESLDKIHAYQGPCMLADARSDRGQNNAIQASGYIT